MFRETCLSGYIFAINVFNTSAESRKIVTSSINIENDIGRGSGNLGTDIVGFFGTCEGVSTTSVGNVGQSQNSAVNLILVGVSGNSKHKKRKRKINPKTTIFPFLVCLGAKKKRKTHVGLNEQTPMVFCSELKVAPLTLNPSTPRML